VLLAYLRRMRISRLGSNLDLCTREAAILWNPRYGSAVEDPLTEAGSTTLPAGAMTGSRAFVTIMTVGGFWND
jgi:hypothetical protein